MRRSGFTIVEFIISISAMLVIMAAVFLVVFNKVQTSNLVHLNETLTCNCSNCLGSNKFVIETIDANNYNIIVKNGINEFVSVKLTGGGAGGGNFVGGGAGHSDEIYLPRLEGEYKITLGEGGAVGQNGKPTAFYQKVDGKYRLIASVAGGVTSLGENKEYTGYDTAKQSSAYSEYNCGAGGAVNSAGTKGEVEISW